MIPDVQQLLTDPLWKVKYVFTNTTGELGVSPDSLFYNEYDKNQSKDVLATEK